MNYNHSGVKIDNSKLDKLTQKLKKEFWNNMKEKGYW